MTPRRLEARSAECRGPKANPEIHAMRAALWHREGLALIDPATMSDPWAAQAVRNEAERLYGRRSGEPR